MLSSVAEGEARRRLRMRFGEELTEGPPFLTPFTLQRATPSQPPPSPSGTLLSQLDLGSLNLSTGNMPSLSSVWNLEPPPAPAPPASSSSSSSLPSSSSSPISTSPRQSSFHDIEKHPSTTTHSYPSVHRTGLSWSGSTSSLHVGNLGGRGAVKRLAFVLAIVSLGLWLVVKSGGSEVASGWTAGRSGSSSSRGKGHVQSVSQVSG